MGKKKGRCFEDRVGDVGIQEEFFVLFSWTKKGEGRRKGEGRKRRKESGGKELHHSPSFSQEKQKAEQAFAKKYKIEMKSPEEVAKQQQEGQGSGSGSGGTGVLV